MMGFFTTAAAAAVSGIWKMAAIALAIVSIVACVFLGHGWYMAADDRDEAVAARDEQKALADGFQAAIREQNKAVEALDGQRRQAEQRGRAAMDLAAANGRRFDNVLARVRDARATTCAEAMPVVDDILGAIR